MTASDSELDAPLLRLAAEYIALYNEINAGLATVDGDVPDKTADRVSAMEEQITLLPVPYTLPGVAALLRVKAACIGTRWPDQIEDRIVLSALNALERYIAGKGEEEVVRRVPSIPEPDAKLLRLNAEYRTFLGEINAGRHNDAKGEVSDEAQERMSSLEHKIAATPAETYAGIGIKLLIGVDNFCPLNPGETRTTDELNLESALADVERLAGRAS